MTRYWVSWWARFEDFIDGTPWPVWCSGERSQVPELSLCAAIDAADEKSVWSQVSIFFPEHEQRFCNTKPDGWNPPSDRFP